MEIRKSLIALIVVLTAETKAKGGNIAGGDMFFEDGIPGITSPAEIAATVIGSILGFLVLCRLARQIYRIWKGTDEPTEEESPELKEELNEIETK